MPPVRPEPSAVGKIPVRAGEPPVKGRVAQWSRGDVLSRERSKGPVAKHGRLPYAVQRSGGPVLARQAVVREPAVELTLKPGVALNRRTRVMPASRHTADARMSERRRRSCVAKCGCRVRQAPARHVIPTGVYRAETRMDATAAHRRRVDHCPPTSRVRKAAAETAGEASARKASAPTTMETPKASASTTMETTRKATTATATATAMEAAAARKGIDATRAQT